jgi:hypothetical protein
MLMRIAVRGELTNHNCFASALLLRKQKSFASESAFKKNSAQSDESYDERLQLDARISMHGRPGAPCRPWAIVK